MPLLNDDLLGASLLSSLLSGPVAKYKPLPPEEQKSAIKQILDVGAGGLQVLGDTLDKPGRAVRGLLSGNVRELGNLIPFSDAMGITDPTQAVSGRQLLEKAGVVGANTDQGWLPDAGDLSGFAADVALDPLTYLTLGASAVGKAGQVAKAAGMSVKGAEKFKTLNQVLGASPEFTKAASEAAQKAGTSVAALGDQKLGGLFGLSVPGLTESVVPSFAQGPVAQRIGDLAEKAIAPIGKIPVAPGMRLGQVYDALFDPAAGGKLNPLEQDVSRRAFAEAGKGHKTALDELVRNTHEYDDLLKEFHTAVGGTDPVEKTSDVLRRAIQLSAEQRNTQGVFDMLNPAWNVPQHLEQKAGAFGDALVSAQDQLFDQLKQRGVDANEITQTADFAHLFRQTYKDAQEALQGGSKLLSTSASGLKQRIQPTKFVPGEYINQMLHDKVLLYDANGQLAKPAEMAATLLDPSSPYVDVIDKAAEAAGKDPEEIAKGLAGFIRGKGDTFLKNDARYYNDDILRNHFDYAKGIAQATANADATHGLFKANLTTDPTNAVPLQEAFRSLGWDDATASAWFGNKYGVNNLQGFVPIDVVNAAKSVREKSTSAWLEPITKVLDPITRFYKENLTLPFPSFHLRNLLSGHWMNLASNEVNNLQDLTAYWNAWKKAKAAVDDPVANRQFLDEMVIHKVLPMDFKTSDVDVLSGATDLPIPKSTSYVTPVVGQLRGLGSIPSDFARLRQESLNLGAGNARATASAAVKAPAEAGREIAKQIEYSNRATMYSYLRDKGWSPEAAAKRTNELQIDYSSLAPFEKNVMRRLIPFYTYSRKNIPEVLKNLYEKPGGLTGQTVRGSNRGRDSNEYIPAYIGEGMSIPTPSGGYVSELGLPTDQFGDYFAKGPSLYGTIRRTAQKLGSQLNPIVKTPIEGMTGINLFTGKPLTDLYQFPTGSLLTNLLIGGSPASRAVSTVRGLFDDRKTKVEKGVNLLTGVKVSHPTGGLEAQADRAAKRLLEEVLREDSGIGFLGDVYVKDGAQLDPETERMYRAYRGIVNEQRKEKKKATAPARP